eukprot:CAMPEP_0170486846 /NCGR_PEP_ID=MMETSP0208-20121228/5769_1 /TAXON_ID=197538 /ORGANISM="Strombidium inclinatum, Strain S3" /LENGTH=166 /DNA_ID=CAMNT_0010760919 /DNA_START=2126 /DNA_END=2623 /DNA_ORIENTATION=+
MTGTLSDIGYTTYFFTSHDFWDDKYPSGHHRFLPKYLIIVSFLPFWFRFWQCLNKYHYTGLKAHLFNAGKYFSKLLPPLITAIFTSSSKKAGNDGFKLYIIFNTIATMYCMVWDYYMDWGLFRSKKSGRFGLRNQTKYNPRFYYFAMFTNFILRFWWVISIFNYPF